MLPKPDYFDGSEGVWKHGITEVFRIAARYDGMLLRFAPPGIRSNKQTVMAAVALDGLALEFASEELRADEDVVNTAIRSNCCTSRFSQKVLRSPFAFASEALRSKRSLALIACEQAGNAYRFLPKCLAQDRTFLRECLQLNGENLRFAPWDFRRSKHWVCVAMESPDCPLKTSDVRSLVYAHESLWADPELLRWAARKDESFLKFWKGGSWSDSAVEAKAMVASTLAELPMSLLLELGRTSRNNMWEVCVLFPDSVQVAKEVASSWPDLHKLLHESVFEDRGVIKAFAAVDGNVVLKSERYSVDPSIVSIAVQATPSIFRWLSDELRDNRDIALTVVSNNGAFFKYVSDRLMRDQQVCMEAALNYSAAMIYVHESVKNNRTFIRELVYKTVERGTSDGSTFSSEFFTARNAFVMLNDVVIRACCHVLDFKNSVSCGSVDTGRVVAAIVEDLPRLAVFAKGHEEFDTAVATIAKHVPEEAVQAATREAHAAYYVPKKANGEDSATLAEWKSSFPVEIAAGGEEGTAAKRPRTSQQ